MWQFLPAQSTNIKGTVSPPERCDLVGVKLEKVHELFQLSRSCIIVTFYNIRQYVLLYDQRLQLSLNLQFTRSC